MNTISLAFLIIGLLGSQAGAECIYFRVSTKLMKCGTVDAKSVHDTSSSYQTSQDLPDLADPDAQTMVQATCECAYSLRGSDMRCDLDQTVERSSVVGTDDSNTICRRGRTLCKEVCPETLP
jgi:hypothetical protein